MYERYAEVSGNPIPRHLLDNVKDLKRRSGMESDLKEQSEKSASVIGKSLNNLAYANEESYMYLSHPFGGMFLDQLDGHRDVVEEILVEERKYWGHRVFSRGFDYKELNELTKI